MGRKDKKPVPISEAPPPVTSLSDVEDSDTSSDDTDDYSSDDEQNSLSTPASKTPSSSAVPSPKQPTTTVVAAADDDDEEDSDDESDDDSPPRRIKPIPPTSSIVKQPRSSLSKPTTTAIATPTTASSVTVAALPSSKRPASEADNNKGSEKRAKKDKSVAEPGSRPSGSEAAATPSKPLFQRLWSDEDEIVILKGLIEYREKKNVDPMTQVDDFLDFIKKSLHVPDANRSQIVSKVRRLKKRYSTAKQKKVTNPHELNAIVLMKQIWGGSEFDDENGDDTKKVDAMESQAVKEAKAKAKPKAKTNGEVNEEKKGLWSIERCENVGGGKVGVEVGDAADLDFGFSRSNWAMVKEAMVKMGDGEKGELKKMVDEAKEAFLKADLLRLEADSLRQKVLEVATKKVLEGMRGED